MEIGSRVILFPGNVNKVVIEVMWVGQCLNFKIELEVRNCQLGAEIM